MFVLFISSTELATIPGLSAAGADPDVVRFTGSSDADLIRFGEPLCSDIVPVDPQGHPTPAIFTKSALDLADEPRIVVDAGAFMPPTAPYITLGTTFGKDPTKGPAVPDAEKIAQISRDLARDLCRHEKNITVAESVPGGTTTALLILRALGHSFMVSSSGPVNPISLKEDVWARASKRINIEVGGMRGRAMEAIRELGDPMQAAVVGFVSGLSRDAEVVLAGGTQMLACAAVLAEIDPDMHPIVATTPYVARDASTSFYEISRSIGVETYVAPMDLTRSRHRGLAEYELGFVKEGVGAGGSIRIAEKAGSSVEEVQRGAEDIYDHLTLKR